MQLKRYEQYKPSGVEWIGEIPTHWQVKKLKYLVDRIDCACEKSDFVIAVENIESKTGRYTTVQKDK